MQRETPARSRAPAFVLRAVLALAVILSLTAGIAGGLLRAGVALPDRLAGASWASQAVLAHAFLMICTFLGTVIGIERAVAIRTRLAFAAPFGSALAGLLMLAGMTDAARAFAVAAAVVFIGVNLVVVGRQRAAHSWLLLVAATAWLLGNLLFAAGAPTAAVLPWWFAFLVLTIAAERLEMARLMRRRRGAAPALYAIVAAMWLGAGACAVSPTWGGVLYGASLAGLAAWLFAFDIARRTVLAHGLSRYMALCLLLGYLWLAVGGAAWLATSIGLPWHDAALHALALGFVFSMMLGHAPVILPAIARVKLQFGWAFYLPLALLHGSLLVRLLWGSASIEARATGAAGNAVAIGLFVATVAGSAVAWQLKKRAATRPLSA